MEVELFKSRVESWLKKLKPSTATPYLYGMYRYCEYLKLEPDELIKEARQDYIDRVPPWEIRSAKHFEDFIQYLKKEDISNQTKLSYLYGIRNFYKFNKVPLAEIEVGIPLENTERYKEVKLLKLEDIRTFVNSCGVDQKLLKALALTFLSSAQSQAEVQKLKGKHLKDIRNGVAFVKMTRGKRNTNYFFFIGKEALDAIHDYKPEIGNEEFVFTQEDGKTKLNNSYIDTIFGRQAEKLGFDKKYTNPHRYRRHFKSVLTGKMTSEFVEFIMGHKLKGVEGSYFDGVGVQEDILKEYLDCQKYLTIYTEQEVLQKQYDDLVAKSGSIESVQEENQRLQQDIQVIQHEHEQDLEALKNEFEDKMNGMQKMIENFMKAGKK